MAAFLLPVAGSKDIGGMINGGEAGGRIRGRKWMRIRERIMVRDCGMCQTCRRKGQVSVGTEVDHIIALSNSGSNDDDNLEVICVECHDRKSRVDFGLKERVTIGADGWPTENAVSRAPVWKRD